MADSFRLLPQKTKEARLKKLTSDEALQLLYDWRFWARTNQTAPINPGWFIWMLMAGRGFGKAMALDTPIPTNAGWSTMADLSIDDVLFDEKGQPCKVTYVSPIYHDHACYRIVFSDGAQIIADEQHEWFTWDRAARKAAGRSRNPVILPKIRTTQKIGRTLHTNYLRSDDIREINHSIPVAEALQCEEAALLIAPYTLGAWLGDGSSAAAEITCADLPIIQEIKADGYIVTRHRKTDKTQRFGIGITGLSRDSKTGCYRSNGSVHSKLKKLGLLGNKHIPAIYLRASYQQRLALLQGLMDTDGGITESGHCEYTSTRINLAEGVRELCLSMGIKATMGEGKATFYGKDCGPKYRITFTPYIPVFRLLRKLERIHLPGAQADRQKRRYIKAVDPVESVPVRCIQVDSPSHLFLAGKEMIPTHNTRTGAEFIREKIENGYTGRVHLIGATAGDVRDVMVEGPAGMLEISSPESRPKYEPSKRRLTWPNGAIGTTFSASEPERLRGPQCGLMWADEIGTWRYQEAWDQAMLGLRIGESPQAVVTTTPRPTKLIREILATEGCVVTKGSTYENRANLSRVFFSTIIRKYEGTRLGRQELMAELLEDTPGALWNLDTIDDHRITYKAFQDVELVRIGVAIDPAVSSKKTSNETGIIAAGVDAKGEGYILADGSGIYTPLGWGNKAIGIFAQLKADRIVAEVNNGGDLVEANLRSISPRIPYAKVYASRGKRTRAEPISALYEQGLVHHVGVFPGLEDQMTTWDATDASPSPDRLDALVWILTYLMLLGFRKKATSRQG